jgi:hypothetical protein
VTKARLIYVAVLLLLIVPLVLALIVPLGANDGAEI